MSQNKNAMTRFLALDKCFQRSGGACIDDLIDACEQAVGYPVSRRTVYNDLSYMEANPIWQIEFETKTINRKVYYAYSDRHFSIANRPLREEESDMLQGTVQLLSRFKGLPGFNVLDELIAYLDSEFNLKGESARVISFEQNEDAKGNIYVTELYEAIVEKKVLYIEYEPFDKPVLKWQIHPYYLKQYNGRWFLFGLNGSIFNGRSNITNIALDRIKSISPSNVAYIENETIDFEEYFDDVIGVTIKPDNPIEIIVLKFTPDRFNFVTTKPIHPYQVEDKENCTVTLKVVPNNELKTLILSFGDDVEVLSPLSYREYIKNLLQLSLNRYEL